MNETEKDKKNQRRPQQQQQQQRETFKSKDLFDVRFNLPR